MADAEAEEMKIPLHASEQLLGILHVPISRARQESISKDMKDIEWFSVLLCI